ncbi:MAG: prepilin-type N-terminal cleavage/methylation domain-containing protein [Enterobacteriaceae bacterium]|nr:prepilin-type N-terminal cleavage/methylation domain-containing protein [Enterobacteriaceae bacterium]
MKTNLLNRQCGMTLMEILLVIAVMAILSTSGINSWQGYQQRQLLEQTSADLLAFLSRVQSAANWHNQTYLLHAGMRGNQRCITASQAIFDARCSSDIGMRFIFPDTAIAVELSQSELSLGFYGLRNTAGAGNIVVSNAAGRVRLILSAKGRLRRCSASINGHQPYLPGIARC